MGRRSGTSSSEMLLRAEIAKALSSAIGEDRGSLSAAAKDLGITKQALSLYVRQKATPGSEVLRRICKHWGLHLNVHGALVDADSLGTPRPDTQPQQLSLFEAIALVQDQRLDVSVLRRNDSSLDLKVTINFESQVKL